jgi:hypothetical protein
MQKFNYDPETSAAILAAIWQRQPLVFVLGNSEKLDPVLENILNFVPEFRQKILCGVLSKKIFYVDKSAKKLDTTDLDSLIETIQTCYQEDGIYSPPIQLIFSAAKISDFKQVLAPLNHGWIATTYLTTAEVTDIFQNSNPTCVPFSEDVTAIFVTGKPTDTILENKLVQKISHKALSVARFMVQMKMSEVKFVCKAFLDEIEKGNKINQVLAEEQFGIDSLTFSRVLMLLKLEYYADVTPYIESVWEPAAGWLGNLIKLNGLLTVLAMKDKKIVAFERKQTTSEFSPEMLIPYVRLLENSTDKSIWGNDGLFIVKNATTKNRDICVKAFTFENTQIFLAFVLDANIQIAMIISQIERIIKAE